MVDRIPTTTKAGRIGTGYIIGYKLNIPPRAYSGKVVSYDPVSPVDHCHTTDLSCSICPKV